MEKLPSSAEKKHQRVLSVFGTRPEIIKFAPVLDELEQHPELKTVNVCTSQHTDLAAPFLNEFQIRVDHDLNAMRPNQSLNALLGRMLVALDDILEAEQPAFVLVQGDTASALAGAMAAFHRKIPVGHIEAGLRSGDPMSPFPEEMNRTLISQIATAHFAATERNRDTLLNEGVKAGSIYLTGNPVVDSVSKMTETDLCSSAVKELLEVTEGTKRIVMTAHRRENFDSNLAGYFEVVREFLQKNPSISLIFPVHPNPSVKALAHDYFGEMDSVHLAAPLPYPDFVRLLQHAWLIVSDSGGIQEEAPSLGKPLLIMRENTERPEAVECGAAKLIGEEPSSLQKHMEEVLSPGSWAGSVSELQNPFGDGESRKKIVEAICSAIG
ncbi:MAG: UDP-N-acetylglucosamine 2-epimerase (non-hydrolyzing) [Verrucomicrobiota bacterium]